MHISMNLTNLKRKRKRKRKKAKRRLFKHTKTSASSKLTLISESHCCFCSAIQIKLKSPNIPIVHDQNKSLSIINFFFQFISKVESNSAQSNSKEPVRNTKIHPNSIFISFLTRFRKPSTYQL